MRTHVVVGLAMILTACSASTFTSNDAGAPGDDGSAPPITGGGNPDAGEAGSTVDAAPPPNCDTSKLPTDDLCVVNDAEGVFVTSSLGSASGDGSREHPLASMNAALALASTNHMRVYACAETFAESIALADGVDTFGYFDCQNGWTVNTASHAKIQSPTTPAATATNIASPTRIEAVDIIAPDFVDQSKSSIALLANASPGLTIKGATIHAGTGGQGASGGAGIKLQDSGSAKNGQAAFAAHLCVGTCLPLFARAGGTNACVGETGHDPGPGGNGGSGGECVSQLVCDPQCQEKWVPSQSYSNGLPAVASAQTTAGGNQSFAPVTGANGANGADGVNGAPFGTLDANGYVASDGSSGADGAPGQGGGGAAGYGLDETNAISAGSNVGRTGWGDYGGSGGAGGCPGLAGNAGKGGGASLAIVALQSAFTLDTVVIESSNGGAGGASGDSSSNTDGGVGGNGATATLTGANGGSGGFAGIGGNGAGGPSVGIFYSPNMEPTQLSTTIKIGQGGAGVTVRFDAGNGHVVPASPNGTASATMTYGG